MRAQKQAFNNNTNNGNANNQQEEEKNTEEEQAGIEALPMSLLSVPFGSVGDRAELYHLHVEAGYGAETLPVRVQPVPHMPQEQ